MARHFTLVPGAIASRLSLYWQVRHRLCGFVIVVRSLVSMGLPGLPRFGIASGLAL